MVLNTYMGIEYRVFSHRSSQDKEIHSIVTKENYIFLVTFFASSHSLVDGEATAASLQDNNSQITS